MHSERNLLFNSFTDEQVRGQGAKVESPGAVCYALCIAGKRHREEQNGQIATTIQIGSGFGGGVSIADADFGAMVLVTYYSADVGDSNTSGLAVSITVAIDPLFELKQTSAYRE